MERRVNVEFLETVQKMREREGKKAGLSHFEGSQVGSDGEAGKTCETGFERFSEQLGCEGYEVSAVGFLLPSTVAKYRAFLVVDAFFALVSDKLDIRAFYNFLKKKKRGKRINLYRVCFR